MGFNSGFKGLIPKQNTRCHKIKEHIINETGLYGIWKFIKSL